jgi:rubredoxin
MRGFVYDESIADSGRGIKAGARWEDIPKTGLVLSVE